MYVTVNSNGRPDLKNLGVSLMVSTYGARTILMPIFSASTRSLPEIDNASTYQHKCNTNIKGVKCTNIGLIQRIVNKKTATRSTVNVDGFTLVSHKCSSFKATKD